MVQLCGPWRVGGWPERGRARITTVKATYCLKGLKWWAVRGTPLRTPQELIKSWYPIRGNGSFITMGRGRIRRHIMKLWMQPSFFFFKQNVYFLFGCTGSELWAHGIFDLRCGVQTSYLQHVGSSSLTRVWTQALCIGSSILSHWTTRELLQSILFIISMMQPAETTELKKLLCLNPYRP